MQAVRRISLAIISAVTLLACSREPAESGETNQAGIKTIHPPIPVPLPLTKADGALAGSVTVDDGPNGVSVAVSSDGLPPGVHGVHLHAVGKCEGPKFESASAHWNPTSRKHGRDNPKGAHLGDLANFKVGANGGGKVFVAVAATYNAFADADGTSLVIHADPDDYKTDPSGNSGDRIACAVISPPSTSP